MLKVPQPIKWKMSPALHDKVYNQIKFHITVLDCSGLTYYCNVIIKTNQDISRGASQP